MPSTLRRVGLEFLETAPHRHVCIEMVPRPVHEVFAAIGEDPVRWGDWYPGFSHAGRYLSPPPHGVGSAREVTMLGVRFREEVLAWEAPHRWAFFVDEASVPFASAFAEDYQFVQAGEGTAVQWTLAIDPLGPVRYATALMSVTLPRLFARATRNLSRHLASASPSQL